MQNFKLIKEKIDTSFMEEELSKALQRRKITVNSESRIPYYATAHTDSIWKHLYSSYTFILEDAYDRNRCAANSPFVYQTDLSKKMPLTMAYLQSIAKEKGGILQRAMFVSLESGGEVKKHVDAGNYPLYRDRYHLVLSSKGSQFFSGDETQIMKEGELWWFDNKKEHSVINSNDSLRLHIIFDLLPKNYFNLWQKFLIFLFEFFLQHYIDTLGVEESIKLINSNIYLKKKIIFG